MVQTKKIVRPLRVQIINSYANKADRMVNQSVLQKHNYVMESATAKMVLMKKKLVVSIRWW